MVDKGFTFRKVQGNKYRFYEIAGKIDTTNADDLYTALQQIQEEDAASIMLSLEHLTYISSAGLRALLKIQKRTRNRILLIHAAEEVYNILAVTGFTSIFTVAEKPKKVNLDQAVLIGQGASGKVYRINEENIIKLYPPGYDYLSLVNEKEAARKLLIKGVPTAIPINIVSVDGSFGLEYEMIRAVSMQKLLAEEPEKLAVCMEKYVDALCDLHAIEVEDGEFPSVREDLMKELEKCRRFYPEEILEELFRVLKSIPERRTLIHRDFHPGNIMVDKNDDIYLIDLGEVSTGHPVIDLMSMGIHYPALTRYEACRPLAPVFHDGMSVETHEKVWDAFINRYYADREVEERRRADEAIEALTVCIMALNPVRAAGYNEEQIRHSVQTFLTMWDRNHERLSRIEDFDRLIRQ